MTYKEQVSEFLQYCKEEKSKGNRLTMGKGMTIQSVPTLKSWLIKLFKTKQKKVDLIFGNDVWVIVE